MLQTTDQMNVWRGDFGREYTDRNALSLEKMESMYQKNFGINRTQLNEKFLEEMSHSIRILEVGCNIGNQLLCLQKMGFTNLYGIELQDYAVELSKSRTQGINIIKGSAFDIPFKDRYFDLVFTSVVLIHIHPSEIEEVIREIYRCTTNYIWGFEYYADQYTEIVYREHKNLLWKANFAQLYLTRCKGLRLVKEERFKYLSDENVDAMFLLKKAE